ncbi:signal peptidase I [Patescibacteria group bacterium]|nr:signal peptidase I [Patescibacteria group bacterium]
MENNKQIPEIEKMMQEEPEVGATSALAFIGELIKITLISLAIIVPVRYFLIKPFYVNGASMEPSFYNHEYLIIDEISYRFSPPQRGDVVVFKYPKDISQFFIKRIIGLPGERVVISNGEVVVYNSNYLEGMSLEEEYLSEHITTFGDVDIVLKEEEYFVLGDNRAASLDSRRFGSLSKDFIIGKAWIRGWPLDRIGILDHYFFGF